MKLQTQFFATLIPIFGISSCGGGGGGTSPPPAPPVVSPTVSISSSDYGTEPGLPFTLTWTSTDANSCTASGAWGGIKDISGNEVITESSTGAKVYILTCTGEDGSGSSFAEVSVVNHDAQIDTWYGTKTPSFLASPPESYSLFEGGKDLHMEGQLEGLEHAQTDSPGAGKLVFNRVYRASKHGLEWGEQFGIFGSWLQSFGANSIEGGLWVNPKTAGPYYYPTLHLAGIGDTYHVCSDVQMGSGLYERYLGDKWLNMVQISNKILTIPGSNIAFDMEQNPYVDDNGIWIGWGWSYLDLDHPRNYRFWLSFVESYDYQGPVNGYIPEYFNWVDPAKISDGRYAKKKADYGSGYGSMATIGSAANAINGNENYVSGLLKVADDLFYVPIPNLPVHKEKEYLIAHPQNISQAAMENYSSSIRNNALELPLIPSADKMFEKVYESTHNQLKIIEKINGEEYAYFVKPSYKVGYENSLGYVQWDFSSRTSEEMQKKQNGYAYVRKLDTQWVDNGGLGDQYKYYPNQYNTELVDAPDDVIRAPAKVHKYFNYKERDTTNPEFANWDMGDKKRYQKKLQNGATVTYVWFKFIEQPAMLSARQNHPEVYTVSYLNMLQTYMENLHRVINDKSVRNPDAPVFINYNGSSNPDNKNPHLAKIDPGQHVKIPEGFEVGYVPIVISVYHPEEYSENGIGLESAPDEECENSDWTDTFDPDF